MYTKFGQKNWNYNKLWFLWRVGEKIDRNELVMAILVEFFLRYNLNCAWSPLNEQHQHWGTHKVLSHHFTSRTPWYQHTLATVTGLSIIRTFRKEQESLDQFNQFQDTIQIDHFKIYINIFLIVIPSPCAARCPEFLTFTY